MISIQLGQLCLCHKFRLINYIKGGCPEGRVHNGVTRLMAYRDFATYNVYFGPNLTSEIDIICGEVSVRHQSRYAIVDSNGPNPCGLLRRPGRKGPYPRGPGLRYL